FAATACRELLEAAAAAPWNWVRSRCTSGRPAARDPARQNIFPARASALGGCANLARSSAGLGRASAPVDRPAETGTHPNRGACADTIRGLGELSLLKRGGFAPDRP